MYPHSPNKLIATKYCFLIVRDDTGFVFFINNFYVLLCYIILFIFPILFINFYKNYFIIIIKQLFYLSIIFL